MGWERPDPRAVGLFEERYGVVRGTSLAAVGDLVQRFGRLPYENLSKILVWDGGSRPPSPRGPLQVMQDHLALGTGGTCFSLTELLRQLVTRLGLECRPVMAHMRHGPAVHCALLVDVGLRRHLVDPGYLVPEPLALDSAGLAGEGGALLVPAGRLPGVPPETPSGTHDLFTMEHDGPRWRYRLDERPPSPDVFRRHWIESFRLPGMRSLVATRRDDDQRRLYIHNHRLRITGARGKENRNVRHTLDATLHELFGIDPRVTASAREALRRSRDG